MNWTKICSTNDLVDNAGVCALFQNKQIALFKVVHNNHVSFFAVSNWDPIGQANVMSRGIIGSVNNEPVISSPLYKQHYSLLTGECLEDNQQTLKVFPIKIVNDQIELAEPSLYDAVDAPSCDLINQLTAELEVASSSEMTTHTP